MKKLLGQHLLQLALVTLVLLLFARWFHSEALHKQQTANKAVKEWLDKEYIDWNDPFQRALWKDMMDIYEPGHKADHADLLAEIEQYRRQQVLRSASGEVSSGVVSAGKVSRLLGMYIKFAIIFIITLLITTYGVQTLGTWRFLRHRQKAQPYSVQFVRFWQKARPRKADWKKLLLHYRPAAILGLKAIAKGAAYLLLFAPAYVIAYSFRTRFDTDFALFMILLGVVSNAMLITYAHKFYTFLQGESRRGYVETALVKNMDHDWGWDRPGGIAKKNVLHWRKRFHGHVFDHIFRNAAWQYRATLKEQASFLISGLIIIEMALNIQDHLCYELLQYILYNEWALSALIVMGIYWLIKATEIAVDAWTLRDTRKMEK